MDMDGRRIGVQVTDLDPHAAPGVARAEAAKQAKAANAPPAFGWGQNDVTVIMSSVQRAVDRKIAIARRHDFTEFDEVWLLVCAAIPHGVAIIPTFIPTPWITPEALNAATGEGLSNSKYARAFLHPIVSVGRVLYTWTPIGHWTQDVGDQSAAVESDRIWNLIDLLKNPL